MKEHNTFSKLPLALLALDDYCLVHLAAPTPGLIASQELHHLRFGTHDD